MGHLQKNKQGFTIVEIIVVLFIAGTLGFIGWYVYRNKQPAKRVTASKPTTQQSTQSTSIYAGWKTYTWVPEGVHLKYPPNWVVTTTIDNYGYPHLSITKPTTDTVYDAYAKTSVTGNITLSIDKFPIENHASAVPLDYIVKVIPTYIGNYKKLNILEHGGLTDTQVLELSLTDTQTAVGQATIAERDVFQSKKDSGYQIRASVGIIVTAPHGSAGYATMTKTDFENLPDYMNMVNVLKSLTY